MATEVEQSIQFYTVPIIRATIETLAGYARIVDDFDQAEVDIVTWPATGWRPVVPGTGNEGGITQDVFEMEWKGDVLHATNYAVGRSYITGWASDPTTASETAATVTRKHLFTHEANYHPDGGQVFYPRDNAPFVALLALPGDDITPESFTAFYCDGSFGIHLNPGVWHQPVFPIRDTTTFDDKQGKVHACIACNFLEEFGCYLKVPLILG